MPSKRLRHWVRQPLRVAVLLAGVAILLAGLLSIAETHSFLQRAVPAAGRVADFKEGRRAWYPIVEFEDGQGSLVRFTSTMGARSPSQDIGDNVAVLYDPMDDTPTRAARVAGGPTWMPALMTAGIGVFLMGMTLLGMRRPRAKGRSDGRR
jgi:hypothetical protein